MAPSTATRRRRQTPANTKSRKGRTKAPATPASIPAQVAAPEETVPLVFPEADPVLADAADRAADLRDQAADDVARILADGEARATELLDGARTEAASIIETAASEQSRLLAVAQADADQIRTAAASTAAADADQVRADAEAAAEQLLADARSEADTVMVKATGEADQALTDARTAAEQVLADARSQAQEVTTTAAAQAEQVSTEAAQAAAKVLSDAETQRTELLAGAERTAVQTRTRATTDAEQVLERARGEADRMRESTDGQAAQVRAGAEKVAAGLRADADRALADARTSAEELRTAADKDAARLREQAEANVQSARKAAAQATADQAAAAQARAEADRILEAATQRTVQRARRREIRAESRAARRKARDEARPVGGVPPLSGQELVLVVGIVLAAAVVSTLGLLSSYTALETRAATWGWDWPWLLPVGIDVAIPAFTGANLILIRMGMELRWIRWVPRVLTAVTVYLNWQASSTPGGRIGHAALTLLWVIFSEIASHVYGTRIGAVTGKKRMETVRRSRWILAPIPTARLRRRMILWEITSYEEALTRLQEQTYLRAQLRETYGRRWRSKAPLEQRMALKLGSAPAELADTLTSEDALTIERVEESARAHPDVSALAHGETDGERERPALTSGAHEGERDTDDDDAQRADGALTRSESDALTERRHSRIRRLYTELGRRPQWTEIRDALTEAGLSDEPVSRPTAQRLRAQVEEATPSA
ncbi:DUF2637 domain-containing protein [Streptomyces sp. 43Y-GA-1]|uniref:DUF2637 domain-containing protein n=1 Tax=Streptomyces sp. 43Y-GA-1 TaxID=2939435 RepID=UPI0020BFB3C0|nr:DUF2637 domain-containing protein [Streptomyces sp. 43Y-GA-1]MCL6293208.1 DUF2637 domain-containing protein [Streptomyces sp. 43Y-GA-1]